MNRNGFFFTFVVFLLTIALILAMYNIKQASNTQTTSLIDKTAFDIVNNKYDNIYTDIVSTKNNLSGRQKARVFPFSYDSGNSEDGNGWIQFEQFIPRNEEELRRTYDALNLYKIFIENPSSSIDTNTSVKHLGEYSYWTGYDTNSDLNYVALPVCVKYSTSTLQVFGATGAMIGKGTISDGCDNDFNISNVKKIELTLTISKDQNMIAPPLCSGAFSTGDGNCKKETYTGDKPGKYFAKIRIQVPGIPTMPGLTCGYCDDYSDANGPGNPLFPVCGCLCSTSCDPQFYVCCVEYCDQNISAYIDIASSTPNTVSFPGPDSFPETFYLMDASSQYIMEGINYHWHSFKVNTKITFKTRVDELRLNNFSFAVSKPGFNNIFRGN